MGACLSFGSAISDITPFSTWNALTPKQKLDISLASYGVVFLLSLGITSRPLFELFQGRIITAFEDVPVSFIVGGIGLAFSSIGLYKSFPLRKLTSEELLDSCYCNYLQQQEDKKSESFWDKVYNETKSFLEGGIVGKLLSWLFEGKIIAPVVLRPNANCIQIEKKTDPDDLISERTFTINKRDLTVRFTGSDGAIRLNEFDFDKEERDNKISIVNCDNSNVVQRFMLDTIGQLDRFDALRSTSNAKDSTVTLICEQDGGIEEQLNIETAEGKTSTERFIGDSLQSVADYLDSLLAAREAAAN